MEVSDEVLNRALLYRDRRDFVIRAGDTGIRVESEKDEPMTETSEHDTLLAHLAWKLSDRHEDIAVEALGYIFRSSQARRVLEEMLRARGADVGRAATSQRTTKPWTRPAREAAQAARHRPVRPFAARPCDPTGGKRPLQLTSLAGVGMLPSAARHSVYIGWLS